MQVTHVYKLSSSTFVELLLILEIEFGFVRALVSFFKLPSILSMVECNPLWRFQGLWGSFIWRLLTCTNHSFSSIFEFLSYMGFKPICDYITFAWSWCHWWPNRGVLEARQGNKVTSSTRNHIKWYQEPIASSVSFILVSFSFYLLLLHWCIFVTHCSSMGMSFIFMGMPFKH